MKMDNGEKRENRKKSEDELEGKIMNNCGVNEKEEKWYEKYNRENKCWIDGKNEWNGIKRKIL